MTRPRRPRIPALTCKLVPVYRCGMKGRRYRRWQTAYLAAAQTAWLDKYCMCMRGLVTRGYDDRYSGEDDSWCECHQADERDETTRRLARWLRWRDGRAQAIAATSREERR